jgi:hypothetical protein
MHNALGPKLAVLRGVLGEIRRMWEELDHRKSLSLPTYVIEDLLARVPEPIGCWWLREPAGTNDGSVRSVSKGGGGEENQPWISEPMLWKMELIAELEVISGNTNFKVAVLQSHERWGSRGLIRRYIPRTTHPEFLEAE